MIEAIMFYALGALSAGIVALMVGPPIWRRAVRLTRREIEETLPMSRAEIQAEKDQLRAQNAVATQRLESTIGQMQVKLAAQMVDIEQKREAITQLTAHGSLSAESRIALETERDGLRQTISAANGDLAEAVSKRVEAEQQLQQITLKLAETQAKLTSFAAEREQHRTELATRDTELDALRDSVVAVKTITTIDEVKRAGLETEMSALKANLAIERHKAGENADDKIAADARRLAILAELEGRDDELTAMKLELAAARAQIEGFTIRLVDGETAAMSLLAMKESKAEMEARLAELEALNTKLEADLAERRQSLVPFNEADSASLRSKLIEIGATVASLSTPNDAPALVPLIAGPATPSAVAGIGPAQDAPSQASLAERIRALQRAGGSS